MEVIPKRRKREGENARTTAKTATPDGRRNDEVIRKEKAVGAVPLRDGTRTAGRRGTEQENSCGKCDDLPS